MGGVRQCSTEDAEIFLTHLVRAGWAAGVKTSVVAFDIAQFFPSLNHAFLLAVLRKQGFPSPVRRFLALYLTGWFMQYVWNSFTLPFFQADIGVALSPVLSALYIFPVFKLFDIRPVLSISCINQC